MCLFATGAEGLQVGHSIIATTEGPLKMTARFDLRGSGPLVMVHMPNVCTETLLAVRRGVYAALWCLGDVIKHYELGRTRTYAHPYPCRNLSSTVPCTSARKSLDYARLAAQLAWLRRCRSCLCAWAAAPSTWPPRAGYVLIWEKEYIEPLHLGRD